MKITLNKILIVIGFLLLIKGFTYAGMPGSKHDFTPTGPNGQNFPIGVCQECHVSHKAQDIRLWMRSANIPPQWDNQTLRTCFECHGYDNILTDLPPLSGVTWGLPGTTPRKIATKSGTINNHPFPIAANANCSPCHPHIDSFKPSCNNVGGGSCHPSPPQDVSHIMHVTKSGFGDCETCHYGFGNTAINPAGHPSAVGGGVVNRNNVWVKFATQPVSIHLRFHQFH